ncbi:hypothetical protein M8C21_032854, partial [Ambrosia artemisiifolia]
DTLPPLYYLVLLIEDKRTKSNYKDFGLVRTSRGLEVRYFGVTNPRSRLAILHSNSFWYGRLSPNNHLALVVSSNIVRSSQ